MLTPNTLTWIDVVQILVIPVLLPALVGLATRWQPIGNLPTLAKRSILIGLALLSQILTDLGQAVTNGTAYDLYGALFLGAVAAIGAELAYQGLYKAPIAPRTADPVSPFAAPVTLASKIAGQ